MMNNLIDNNFGFSFKFLDIFPDYESFKTYTDEIGATTKNVEDKLNEDIYYKLTYKYYNRDVNYDVIDAFKASLAIPYLNELKRYKKRLELIDKIYGLDLNELLDNGIVVSNYAGNDKANIDDPSKPINYIINQNSTFNNKPKLEAYLYALETIPSQCLEEFLDSFNYLFSPILKPYIAIFNN